MFLKEKIQVSQKKNRDLLLLCSIGFLLIQRYGPDGPWWIPAIICGISAFLIPNLFSPVTYLWLMLGDFIGTIVSKLILFIVYVFILIPMSLIKRNELKNKFGLQFYGASERTYFEFTDRSAYSLEDIKNPY